MGHALRHFLVVTGVFVVLALSPSSRTGLEEIHRWQLDEVNGNVVTIGVDVGSGNCDHFNRIDVSETEDRGPDHGDRQPWPGPSKYPLLCG